MCLYLWLEIIVRVSEVETGRNPGPLLQREDVSHPCLPTMTTSSLVGQMVAARQSPWCSKEAVHREVL